MKYVPIAGLLLDCSTASFGQFYDPSSGQLPSVLLSAPADGIAHFRAKEKVRKLVGAETLGYWDHDVDPMAVAHAKEAEPLAEQLVRNYPRDPENWLLLATTKKLLNKHAEAAEAYVKEASISGFEPYSGYNAAVAYMRAGNKRAALDMIRGQILERHTMDRGFYFDSPEFKAFHDDPEFLKLVGRENVDTSDRVVGWNYDLDFLVKEVERTAPDYRNGPLPDEFLRRYAELKKSIPVKTNEEMLVGMNWMLASLHQGHTQLFAVQSARRVSSRGLPVKFYLFPDGLHIIDALPPYSALIGRKVVELGGVPAEEAVRRAAAIRSVDGDMEYVQSSLVILGSIAFLRGLGMASSDDWADIKVRSGRNAVERVRLVTAPNVPWNTRRPSERLKAPLMFYKGMKSLSEVYLPSRDTLYVPFNQVLDEADVTLQEAGLRLNGVIREHNPHNLILDMRANNGGNGLISTQLMRTLIAFNRKAENKLYVLIGRRTYSAAAIFVSDLERYTDAIFVGEPTGECCNLHGDPSHLTLPWSGISGELTMIKWNHSSAYDTRRELAPDVPVQLTARDYFSGKDPALDVVYRLIDEDSSKSRH